MVKHTLQIRRIKCSVDCIFSNQPDNPGPKRLQTLAYEVEFPGSNTLLHQFVLDNSDPNVSGSGNYINAVLRSMSDVSINARNRDGYTALHLAVLKNNPLMVKKLLSCLRNIAVDASRDRVKRPTDFDLDVTALHLAAKLGYLSIVQELLNEGASIDLKNHDGKTALFIAMESKHLDIAKLLVSKGANVNLRCNGRTPLCYAADSGYLETAQCLVRHGADVNKYDRIRINMIPAQCLVRNGADVNEYDGIPIHTIYTYNTPLHYAAKRGDLEIAALLLDEGAEVDALDLYSKTPLNNAVKCGKLEILKLVVAKGRGTHLHAADVSGYTLFHYALDEKSFECAAFLLDQGANLHATGTTALHRVKNLASVEFLIDRGADLCAVDRNGRTPLHVAILDARDLAIVKFFIGKGADLHATDKHGRSPLHYAVYNNVEWVEFLLDQGADVDVVDLYSKTPLNNAVKCGKLEILKLVVAKGRGTHLHAADVGGYTLFHYALEEKSFECAAFLLDQGANLHATGTTGKTALHRVKNLASAEFLIDRGADLCAVDMKGRTPLHVMVLKARDLAIVKFFIGKGADLHATDKYGRSPLHYAVYNNVKWVKFLLDQGAAVHADEVGWTPVHTAAYIGNVKVMRVLLERGANLNAKSKGGKTPLDLARKRQNQSCIDALRWFSGEKKKNSTTITVKNIRALPL